MKKPKPFEYQQTLTAACYEAQREHRGQTVEQAKKAFREHFHRAAQALYTILENGPSNTADTAEAVLVSVTGILNGIIRLRRNPEAGRFILAAGQALTRAVVKMAKEQPPPSWLVEEAPKEYEVPWLMVNGKPAPGFAESDAALAWGRNAIRRSKNRFDAPQTRAVAEALRYIHYHRTTPDFANQFAAITGEHGLQFVPFIRREHKRLAALPPLCRKTAPQWWPIVRERIHHKPTPAGNRTEPSIFKKDTPAARRRAFLKDCKKAFLSLCPVEPTGDK